MPAFSTLRESDFEIPVCAFTRTPVEALYCSLGSFLLSHPDAEAALPVVRAGGRYDTSRWSVWYDDPLRHVEIDGCLVQVAS